MNELVSLSIILLSTIFGNGIYILKKKYIYDDFNAFEMSVFEIVIRSFLLLILYFVYDFSISLNHTLSDYSIISLSTAFSVAMKFVFYNMIKNTENISIISTLRSIISIIILFIFESIFLNKQITYYNILAIIWISIGLLLLLI